MSLAESVVHLADRVPGPIAAIVRSHSNLARVGRALFNRIGPVEETVVTVRSGSAKGLRLPIMPRSEKYYWTGTHERHVQDALTSILQPGMHFWDVGAHIGFFTLIAARLVGRLGHVTAFEPMPETRARLRLAIALNGVTNVTVRDFALTSSAGMRTLHPPGTRAPGLRPAYKAKS